MFTPISGRSVLVAGGAKGIGKGLAARFAAEGAKVMIVSRDCNADEQAAAERAAAGGGPVFFQQEDVSSAEGCAAAASAGERHGGLDIVCCNADIFPPPLPAEMTPEQLGDVLEVNLKGTFFIVQAALPPFRRSGRGRVIVTSPITGPITGFSGSTHYGASKADQLGFIRSAALELAKSGITVNAILPGNIMTEGLADLGPSYIVTMEAAIPFGRLGSIENIANAALFLATEEAADITAQTIVIDSGQTVPESLEARG
jgi:3-oxoacyl-[acyl-carrier protein] reductase